ncbi:MAG TPA: nucleoside recognition domain-containing protein [Fredinandcohnia sp.]|nr:nucleoside recognition domain-containing protein [Fredinandcohnia sp.]
MALVWFLLLASAFASAVVDGKMDGLTQGALRGAEDAIGLVIGLAGILALWMGLMRIADEAGLTRKLAAALRPALRRLFPEVPRDHAALDAMALNVSANVLGLGNAATPFGLRAMEALQTLNPHPRVATDAMILFLVINTSSVQLVPATVIALRAANGAPAPTEVLGPTLLATTVSTVVGILAAKWLARLGRNRPREEA